MAKILEGKAICDRDGEFSWHGYVLQGGEVIVGRIQDFSHNFECATKEGNTYVVQACCPKCKRIVIVNM